MSTYCPAPTLVYQFSEARIGDKISAAPPVVEHQTGPLGTTFTPKQEGGPSVSIMPPGSDRQLDILPARTEADVLACLRRRYSESHGNGDRWAFATHVKSHAGFYGPGSNYAYPRIADAVAMDLWPSKGLEVHGHEVKVSRSDWLTELKAPEKCQPVKRYCDRWWLVVSDRGIVKSGELPADWGLMVVSGDTTRVVVKAPKLSPEPLARDFVAPLLRAAVKTERRRAA